METVADLYVQEIDQVIEKSGAAVVLCALPLQHLRLVTHTSSEEEKEQEEPAEASAENKIVDIEEEEAHVTYDFHDLLKAKSLHLRTPLQVVLPATYDKTKNAAQKQLLNRDQQDEATRAWNLFTALYYVYETYPGTYPPRSLYLKCMSAQKGIKDLAHECLILSKMNWNNTRFDGHLPITLRAAKQVGKISQVLGR